MVLPGAGGTAWNASQGVTPVRLQPPLPAALHVLHRWAPAVRVEATAGSAPIQFVSPWNEPLTRLAARGRLRTAYVGVDSVVAGPAA
ncbi:hypothetical protein ABT369_26125 [Dactylosporangium sp. NPDC000244]|uniref:hypothetical protein n=1 Tax=Dactylosporangium sp. NPDC000244 TaxID=3154365 RepID=UPI003328E49C